jgi:hypothetical protein
VKRGAGFFGGGCPGRGISLLALNSNYLLNLLITFNKIINNWMRGRATLAFLGLWETLNNSGFKPLEFERFKNEARNNYFVLSPQKWIEKTNAIGIISKSGRYGGLLHTKTSHLNLHHGYLNSFWRNFGEFYYLFD